MVSEVNYGTLPYGNAVYLAMTLDPHSSADAAFLFVLS
jgi:hypothetical protein